MYFHTIKSILNNETDKASDNESARFPYYKVYFKLGGLCGFTAADMDFHTIKSILNSEVKLNEEQEQEYFHTIKSILNVIKVLISEGEYDRFPYYKVYFKLKLILKVLM